MAVLIAAAVFYIIAAVLKGGAGKTVRVTIDGKLFGEYSLSDGRTVEICSERGHNRLVIENGAAYVGSADCPDGYCMEYAPISKRNETIVCLPHRLVIEVIGGADAAQADVVAQ